MIIIITMTMSRKLFATVLEESVIELCVISVSPPIIVAADDSSSLSYYALSRLPDKRSLGSHFT